MKPDYEIEVFKTAAEWRQWLDANHATTPGIWIRMYKKATGLPTVTYAEALDDALCYGWIDGLVRSFDEQSYIQKFTPRRKKSTWSKRNTEYIARLTEAGLMMPAGIAEVERAKEDGRWDAAYDMQSAATVPDYFVAELKKHPKAEEFFANLNKSNRFAIVWGLQTAKTDVTRIRRMEKFIAMLNAEKKLY